MNYLSVLPMESMACNPSGLCKSDNFQIKNKIEIVNKKMLKLIESRLQPSRADLYILPALQGDIGVAGYFVPFKSLRLTNRSQVSLDKLENENNVDVLRPIASCRPVLLHSLLQKLNLYFTRIGLTNSFKAEQEAVVKLIMEKKS